jgi:RimJ/RimL family protein N-acetyltransferase
MLKAKKVFSLGRVINNDLYKVVQLMDKNIFAGCNNEFKENREWWVILDDMSRIVAYCGSIYTEGICIFVRAWVKKSHRGKGIQKKMIRIRTKAAKDKGCYIVITYTTKDNYPSVNNLIAKGFKFYFPEYAYGGKEMLYWSKQV